VSEDIFYLGHSGVVTFGGLRIAGLSGIYKSHDYHKVRRSLLRSLICFVLFCFVLFCLFDI
jgi:hypothetical protein